MLLGGVYVVVRGGRGFRRGYRVRGLSRLCGRLNVDSGARSRNGGREFGGLIGLLRGRRESGRGRSSRMCCGRFGEGV